MNFAALNGFDYCILALIAISVLFALFRGFIQTFLSFMGWIVAAVVTYYSLPFVKPFLLEKIHNKLIVDIGAAIGIYILALIVMAIINYRILHLTREIRGGAVDMSLGFAFGLVRGMIITSVLFLVILLASPLFEPETDKTAIPSQAEATDQRKGPGWLRRAETYPLLKTGADTLTDLLPAHLQQMIANTGKANSNSPHKITPLSPGDADTVSQIVNALPKSTLPGSKLVTPEKAVEDIAASQNADLLRAIIAAYREAVRVGLIPENRLVSEERIRSLEKALNRSSANMSQPVSPFSAEEPKYNKKQLQDIDRLIQTLH